jgi:hypothetical protein
MHHAPSPMHHPPKPPTWKKGFQSMYSTTSSMGYDSNTLVPSSAGLTGALAGSDQSALKRLAWAWARVRYLCFGGAAVVGPLVGG